MKREYTFAPAWVDYTYQFVRWLDQSVFSAVSSKLTLWRVEFCIDPLSSGMSSYATVL